MTEKTISLSTYYYNKTEIDNLLNNKLNKSINIVASEDNLKDLNDYKDVGFYYNGSNDSCAYISNLPVNNVAFYLLVENFGGYSYVKQTCTTYSATKPRTFIRTKTANYGWGDWKEISHSDHVHGNITSDGKIGSDTNKPIITTTGGKLTTGSFGTTANTFCQGNDSRLSNARTPTSHEHGNITNDGKIGLDANKPIITTTDGALSAGEFESSTSNIKMNGPVNVGSLNTFARADHIHPSDTSKSDINHTHTNLQETSAIPSDSDLNNELYTIEGYYKVKSGESKTLSNRPYPDETYNTAARIEVKVYKNGAYYEYIQLYYTYKDNINIYYRRGYKVDVTTSAYTPLTWGNWKKIANFEALSTVATSGLYEDLDHLPELKTVATSGSYEDLDDLPSIPIANTTNTNIKVNGVQDAGSLDTYAKADHVHPINTKIPNNADLNDETYIVPGFYFYPSTNGAPSILNYPDVSRKDAFTLLVEKISLSPYNSTKHTLTMYNSNNTNPRTFIRVRKTDGTWNNWKELSFTDHTHSYNNLTDKLTLNNTVTSTSTTEVATANAVKIAYDKGNHSHPYISTAAESVETNNLADDSVTIDKINGDVWTEMNNIAQDHVPSLTYTNGQLKYE